MNQKKISRLNDILLRKGSVGQAEISRAEAIQDGEDPRVRRSLGEILVQDLGVDRTAIDGALAEMWGFTALEVTPDMLGDDRVRFVKSQLGRLPEATRQRFIEDRVLPFACNGGNGDTLVIVVADPRSTRIQELANRLGYRSKYERAYVRSDMLDELAGKILPERPDFKEILLRSADLVEEVRDESSIDEVALDAEINQSKLTGLAEGMLAEAVRQGASDIHIVPSGPGRADIYFRHDGQLQLWYSQEGVRPEAVSAVVKDRCVNADRFERDRPQDGFIQRKIDGHNIRFRVSIIPIVGRDFDRKFESIVIRILDDRMVMRDLGKLGFQRQARADFEKAIRSAHGLVILTGPTGCGKSTTLQAALCQVIRPELCVLTTEDPVEYIVDGARQLKISNKMDFDMAVRAILRHDPDIVMVGEMRDHQTALTAIKLANTGHLTFSTLHTNDAPSAVARLFKMGIEPFLIANAINIIVAQRLIRTLCDKCKKPVENLDPKYPISLGMTPKEVAKTTFYGAVGCEACRNGYKGRVAIHEALCFTREIRDIIANAGQEVDEDAIRQAGVKRGMLLLRQSALGRVKEGKATLEEAEAQTTEDEER